MDTMPMVARNDFGAAVKNLLAQKTAQKMRNESIHLMPEQLGSLAAPMNATSYVASALAGYNDSPGLGSIFSKARKAIKKVNKAIVQPVDKTIKKTLLTPIKTIAPPVGKKVEAAVDHVGKVIDDNKKTAAVAAAVVVGTIYGGPAVGAAIKSAAMQAGTWASTTAAPAAIKMAQNAAIGAATGAALQKATGKNVNVTANAVNAALNTKNITTGDQQAAIKLLGSDEFANTVSDSTKNFIQQQTGLKLNDLDFQNLLKAGVTYDLQKTQQAAMQAQPRAYQTQNVTTPEAGQTPQAIADTTQPTTQKSGAGALLAIGLPLLFLMG